MAMSRFFCENLLSDYIDGVLPQTRETELKEFIKQDNGVKDVHEDLLKTLNLLRGLPPQPISHEVALQISEASHPRSHRWLSRGRISRLVLAFLVPFLVFGSVVVIFPRLFPWFTELTAPREQTHFVRYFPLLQGASDIIEEQATWLRVRGPLMRSFWEEGGLSPEEFEKAFSVKLPSSAVESAEPQ